MYVVLDVEESWSLMSLITAAMLDQVEVTGEGREAIRDWRNGLREGGSRAEAFAVALNGKLGTVIDEELAKRIRRRDYYRAPGG